jgi:regulator of protease activity HflC (stomatin/prohibitin superfamily)
MFTFLAIISFLAIIYGILSFIVPKATNGETQLPLGIPILLVGIVVFILSSSITKVGAQETGVLITPRGVVDKPLVTGWHIVMPWNSVEMMDKTLWVYTFSNKKSEGQVLGEDAIWTPTKDGIKMGLDISISWRIDPAFAPWIYQNVSEADGGNNARYLWIEQNLIRASTKSVLALTVSDFTPIEVYSNKRQNIQDIVLKNLHAELIKNHIVVEQVDIREVFYNSEYETAINAKKLAEQEVLRLVEVTKQKTEQLKQAGIDKDMVIQTAMGESEALKIKGQSITNNPKIIQLQWIDKWNGQLPTYMMGSGQGIMMNMNNKE